MRDFFPRATGAITKGTYVGRVSDLQGHQALVLPVRDPNSDKIKVQFDDVSTGFGHGWHEFPKTDFEISSIRARAL
jgi:hypothetical protein